MSGRRLYDKACDARASAGRYANASTLTIEFGSPAWSFLGRIERQFWNDLARSITPRTRRS